MPRKIIKPESYPRKLVLISPTNSGKPRLYDMRHKNR